MSNYYSDPTASAAIGAIDKELSRLKKRAKRMLVLRQAGKLSLTSEELAAVRREFRGPARYYLMAALGEIPEDCLKSAK